ncbi:hypothetical protein EST38_g11763 [Candolleomyces aberdarensis]|uniref:Uncharacterized protein n=1 Tax=Candolleomyces aberdarensis TaxID=2316362 RepID=A0A4Q2D4S7_9AGAR|nr:hypothetical protein EST38_g11763 [Candolleomyces aberdarensis]
MANLSKSVSNLEKMLRASSRQTDKELFQEEGQQMQDVIRQLRDTDKEGKRKAMGPVISLFCGEYLEARKAVRDGRGLKFQREWEPKAGSSKTPATSSSKTPAASPSKKPAASSKPSTSQKPAAASTSQTKLSKPSAPAKTPAAQAAKKMRATEDLFAHDLIREQAPQAPAGKPSGEQKKIATKTPAKGSQAGGKPAAGSSKTLAGVDQSMDVDKPTKTKKSQVPVKKSGETKAGGVKGKGKEKETAPRQRPRTEREEHEHGEASYDPAEDSDSGGYEDKEVGEKQKGKPGQKGNKAKKPKSVAILGDTGSESDVPTIP